MESGGKDAGGGWDPVQYNRFAGQREEPFWDLVGLLGPVDRPDVVDLGCGDGRLTAVLHASSRARTTTGIDRSPSMLAQAAGRRGGGLAFEPGDITSWERPDGVDVVVANASLQWIPDHAAVLGRWSTSVREHGQLAVQVPANADHPLHLVAMQVAAEFICDPPPDPVAANVLAPDRYAEILDNLGFSDQHVRLQVYAHHLRSTVELVEWAKGSTLTRFKADLDAEAWDEFVARYRRRLLEAVGHRSPYLFLFKRILLWGRR